MPLVSLLVAQEVSAAKPAPPTQLVMVKSQTVRDP
eukprot:SAG31_NODE_32931_length_350_cov_0.621514_1_plen_34_part_10